MFLFNVNALDFALDFDKGWNSETNKVGDKMEVFKDIDNGMKQVSLARKY